MGKISITVFCKLESHTYFTFFNKKLVAGSFFSTLFWPFFILPLFFNISNACRIWYVGALCIYVVA